ncbi:ribonuclease E activity regulator RraA [Kordiimonas aquimaris]|uniref:ribonuclease E activity regulator RraA n=1 Tax=Kordiimonas aquimaris TaxID=707591 RepID=UPI0021D2EDDE|nr:ribonuclease E activity regulator RraA [Kordiimonas aquimaris]
MRDIPTPKLATADVCDAKGVDALVLDLSLNDYGGRLDFAGPAVTLRTLDDNTKLKELVGTPGEGRVIVVDGRASERSALLGGNLAAMAAGNGWAGVILNACVRDVHELYREDIGIKAIGTCPRRSEKQNRGEIDAVVTIGGILIYPGDWVIADGDGVVVCRELPSL